MTMRAFGLLLIVLVVQPTQPIAQTQESHAEEAVVVEEFLLEVDVAEDGLVSSRQQMRARVQSSAGLQQMGTVLAAASRLMGSAEIDYVRVRKPSGQVIETPVSTAIDVPADVTRSAPTYSDIYLKHVNVQGLAVGDTVEYAFRVTQQSPLPGHFTFDFQFPPLPIMLSQELRLRVPVRMRAQVKTRGVQPAVVDRDGIREYVWRRATTRRPSDAELMTLMHELTKQRPEIQVTTLASWPELGARFQDLWRDRAAVTPAIRAKAMELTQGLTTDDARAQALYNFVATRIRYVAVQMGIGRLQPHPAEAVLANGFGDCKDKHTLLASLLSAVGLEARAALIGVEAPTDVDVPTWGAFNHVITSVMIGGRRVWLDSTLEVAPFDFLPSMERDKSVLVFGNDGPAALESTPADTTRPDLARTALAGTVTDAGRFEAMVDVTLAGDIELLFRTALRSVGQPEWPDLLKDSLLSLPAGATISGITTSALEDTSAPLSLRYKVTVDTLPDWSSNTLASLLPPLASPPAAERMIPYPSLRIRLDTSIRLELPEGLIARLADGTDTDVQRSNPWGEFRRTTRLDGRIYTVDQRQEDRLDEIPVDLFEDYRAFHSEVTRLRDSLTFTRRKPWTYSDSTTIDWYAGASPATVATLQESSAQAQRGDREGALARVAALDATDADAPAIALVRAWLAADAGNRKLAVEVLREQVRRAPSPSTYKLLARNLWSMGARVESLAALKAGQDRYADDREFPLYLGESYVVVSQFADAARVLESRLDSEGDSARLHWNLGRAYIGLNENEKAVEALRKAVALDASPHNLNQAARQLADAKLSLDDAVAWATRAVNETEAGAGKIALTSLTDAQLREMQVLAAYWDTLAWALFHKGDTERAEAYLLAAWDLTQGGIHADHLGDLYREKGDRARAETFFARGAVTLRAEPRSAAKLRALSPQTAASIEMRERRALAEELRFTLPRVADATGTVHAFVLLSPGGRVEDVRFVSGSESLRPGIELLRAAAIPSRIPAGSAAKVVRRAMAFCATGTTCEAVLIPVDAVTSVR